MTSKDKSGNGAKVHSPSRVVVGTISDTTWRMFAPTLLGIIGGYYLDEYFGTSPWILLAGVIFGAVAAGLLVWRQIR